MKQLFISIFLKIVIVSQPLNQPGLAGRNAAQLRGAGGQPMTRHSSFAGPSR